eukprot:Rmarinus@m.22102
MAGVSDAGEGPSAIAVQNRTALRCEGPIPDPEEGHLFVLMGAMGIVTTLEGVGLRAGTESGTGLAMTVVGITTGIVIGEDIKTLGGGTMTTAAAIFEAAAAAAAAAETGHEPI